MLYRPDEKGGIASYNPLIYFNSVENNISVAVNCYSSDAATPETSKQFICKINNINLQYIKGHEHKMYFNV